MSESKLQMVLCVDDTLATGKRVVVVYGRNGGPICCWDAASLPDNWFADTAWHPTRIVIGEWATSREISAPLPVLRNYSEESLAEWLANTYHYLAPLLGLHACALSSSGLFKPGIIDGIGHLDSGVSVLEVGGSDQVATACGVTGCNGWAVDPTFRDAEDSDNSPVRKKKGMVEALPFPDAAFDVVICLFVLEHLVNPRVAMGEMSRVLKPGGVMFLGIPVASNRVGVPPFLHRWRFVFDGSAGAERTLPLTEITDGAFGLTPSGPDAWRPVAQEKDACLFKLRKTCHG